jgi:hypothetical protein
MTLIEQRRWLLTRQQWAQARLHDASVMVIGQEELARAHVDLAATTALLQTLDERHERQLPLFPERTSVWP